MLWAIYSDEHPEVDVRGDRDGLHRLADAIESRAPTDLTLDPPPESWQGSGYLALHEIRIVPSAEPEALIRFQRDQQVLVVSGNAVELCRILSGSIAELADGPAKVNGVGSHLHLDPTSDPDGRYYTAGSGSLVIGLESGR